MTVYNKFFTDEETTKKYVKFLKDVIKDKSKTSKNLVAQVKIQKELLLLNINVTTILKMDVNEAVNYIMTMITNKELGERQESDAVSGKIDELVEKCEKEDSVREVIKPKLDIHKNEQNKSSELYPLSEEGIDTSDLENIDLEESRKKILNQNPIPVEDVLKINEQTFDKEREILRDSVFNKKVTIQITKSGKNYHQKWNVSMTNLTVKIPTTWEIDIDQSLLLELYTKVFNSIENNDKTELISKLTKSLDVNNVDSKIKTKNTVIESTQNEEIIIDENENADTDNGTVEDTQPTNRNKRVNLKEITDLTDEDVINLFEERKDKVAGIDSYTSVRSLIKRALGISYSEATERITNALVNIDDDILLNEYGIKKSSHLYRNITKLRNNNA